MSRFYASIQGSRGEATRQGTPSSGIEGHIRGWDLGIRVICHVDVDGEDICRVFLTSGSKNSPFGDKSIGSFKVKDLKNDKCLSNM